MHSNIMYRCHYSHFRSTKTHFVRSPDGSLPNMLKYFTKKDISNVIHTPLLKGLYSISKTSFLSLANGE